MPAPCAHCTASEARRPARFQCCAGVARAVTRRRGAAASRLARVRVQARGSCVRRTARRLLHERTGGRHDVGAMLSADRGERLSRRRDPARDRACATPARASTRRCAPPPASSTAAPPALGWRALAPQVVPIAADLTRMRLGLSPRDLGRLGSEVTHVIHAGATVRFDEPIHRARQVNAVRHAAAARARAALPAGSNASSTSAPPSSAATAPGCWSRGPPPRAASATPTSAPSSRPRRRVQRAMARLPVTVVRPSIVGPAGASAAGSADGAARTLPDAAAPLLDARLALGARHAVVDRRHGAGGSGRAGHRRARAASVRRRALVPPRRGTARLDPARARRDREPDLPRAAARLRAAAPVPRRDALSGLGPRARRCSSARRRSCPT